MKGKNKRNLRTWMLLYAALFASVGLAGQQDAADSWDAARVSPVSLSTDMPGVSLNALMRRSDI